MKSVLKLLFIFFMAMVSFCVEPSDFRIHEIPSGAYIQSLPNESLVLVSNNFNSGEVYSYQEENNQNSSGNSTGLLTYVSNNNLSLINKTHLYGCFIHNLSTNLKKVQPIRAP